MKRNESQWPGQEDLDKMHAQAPEDWNKATDEDLDQMFEEHKKDIKEV